MGNTSSAADDTLQYRTGYPGLQDDPTLTKNVQFYGNKIPTSPGNMFIDDLLKPQTEGGHYGDYDWLERDHSYIQWLFPIRERGLNPDAQVLQLAEANLIAASADLKDRIRKSYEMMLDFYGMQLTNAETGAVARKGDGDDSFLPNYANLNKCGHNYLRITRILKCLGEMGFEHYKKPFVMHVAREIYTHGHLTNCEASCLNYWGQTLRNEDDRASVTQGVKELVAAANAMDPPLKPELYEGHIGFGRFGMYY